MAFKNLFRLSFCTVEKWASLRPGIFSLSSWWQPRWAGGLWLPWLVVLNPLAFPKVRLLPVLITRTSDITSLPCVSCAFRQL